jgi:5-amino-6-(5-phosphoribosylamino)uracil reductase
MKVPCMPERPYVTLSCAMSIDGYLDTAGPDRLALSNAADLDRVDLVRSENDAIMVGASTVRRDNPRLVVRNADRRAAREAAGLPGSPLKVTVTARGDLNADAAFFTAGDAQKIVYTPRGRARRLEDRLRNAATVIGLGERVTMAAVLHDLASQRGVHRLMVEGGSTILTQFLAEDLADELQLVVAPIFVGEARAPRIVTPAAFPWSSSHRATLASTRQIGDVVLLRYALSDRFDPFQRDEPVPDLRDALPVDAR